MPNETQSEIYNKTQLINVLHKNEVYIERNLLINITEYEDVLVFKNCLSSNTLFYQVTMLFSRK